MNILDELVAKGVSSEVIVAVAKLIADVEHLKADAEVLDRQRTAARERMRSVRERSRTVPNRSRTPASFLEEDLSKKLKKEPRSRAKPKTALPDDWQPKGSQRDPTEPDEFRNKARANAWTYADWDAAYLNYQNHPEYNHRNKNGAAIPPARPTMTAAEGRALVEAKRLQILREAEDVEKGKDAGLRRDTDVGDGRQRQSPQLRLAGGISHEDAERRRAEGDALLAATTSALRR